MGARPVRTEKFANPSTGHARPAKLTLNPNLEAGICARSRGLPQEVLARVINLFWTILDHRRAGDSENGHFNWVKRVMNQLRENFGLV